MSLPYTPPSPAYISVEEIVKRAPNLGYQAYLADKRAIADIEANVCPSVDISIPLLISAARAVC